MMPGMGRMNSRQMAQMMRKLGINVKEIEGVEEVIIRAKDKEYVFGEAEVTLMDAQGQRTFQITGKYEVHDREVALKASEDDVKLVMEQTGCSEEKARKALEECSGDIAEAILKLSE